MSPEQWDELDWYEKLVYLEGLENEGLIGDGENDAQPQRSRSRGKQRKATPADMPSPRAVEVRGDVFWMRKKPGEAV